MYLHDKSEIQFRVVHNITRTVLPVEVFVGRLEEDYSNYNRIYTNYTGFSSSKSLAVFWDLSLGL